MRADLERAEALGYPPGMRTQTLIVPALLFTFASVQCKDETPENLPGEFGEPCIIGEADDTPDGCAAGLKCFEGYCEELCTSDVDCQPVEGWNHDCLAGTCQIFCDENKACPQTLAISLQCGANALVCEAKDEDRSQ